MIRHVPAMIGLLLATLVTSGCTTTRSVMITVDPPDALIRVDNNPAAPVPKTPLQFTFDTPYQTHNIYASRKGYNDKNEIISKDDRRNEITMKLQREHWMVNIFVEPIPATVSIDGKPISSGDVSALSHDMEFGVDPKSDNPVTHEITASRENWQPASIKVDRGATVWTYTLELKPLTRKISIDTKPSGAKIFVDDVQIGVSPMKEYEVAFPYDVKTRQFPERKLRAELNGYEPHEQAIVFADQNPAYSMDFAARHKQIRIWTDPDGAKVTIDGADVPTDALGRSITTREFPPINANGDLKTYAAVVSKKADDSEWESQTVKIGWDNGKEDYRVSLAEIRTKPVPMLIPTIHRTQNSWEIVPEWASTQAAKDVSEPAGRPSPEKIHALAKGFQLGSVALSPDGTKLLFTTMTAGADASDFKSQICIVGSDGTAERQTITDGKSVDIMPSFTPDGEQVIFSSNRGGRRFNIWRVQAKSNVLPTRLTNSDANDLWPMIDSDPRPRLFYQTMVDTRLDPRIYLVQLGTSFPTDLTMGTQPRVSPKNDAILYCIGSETSINRDLFRIADTGGAAENLTNTPDADECDVSWSRDGSKAVFASDRGTDERGKRNYDIWMIDLRRPNQPIQITANGSRDDSPVFDRTGSNIYFRSNRGGEWAIWKVAVPR